MNYKKYFLLAITIILLSITAVSADNNTNSEIWVSVDGMGDGSSIDNPTNMSYAIDNLKDESTINMLDGNYISPQYYISKAGVIIQAVNPGNVVFDGHKNNEIFRVGGNRVTLSGLTFKDCYISAYGGAVYWFGMYGTLKDCTFINNEAFSGGALFWQSDDGLVENCIFEGNFAGGAGAIHWSGEGGKIVNTLFVDNIATSSDGGAIHWSSDNGIIENCSFINNSATKYIGGAICWSGENGLFLNNGFIDNYDAKGYQFYNNGGTVSFANNTFNNKKAIFNNGIIKSNLKIIVLDNETKYVGLNTNIVLTAIITDDKGNRVGGKNPTFLIGNNSVSSAVNEEVVYSAIYKIAKNKTIVSGNYQYGSNLSVYNATIIPCSFMAWDVIMYYKNGTKYEVFSQSDEGEVAITLNGKIYYRSFKNNKATLDINLLPGIYKVTANYENYQLNNTICVLPTLNTTNLVKVFGNSSQFVVKVLTKSGLPLKNAKISLNINGKIYKKTSDSNGIAILNINLNAGDYIITTIGPDGCAVSNKITVLPCLVENNNLVKYFKNGSKYSVKVLDGKGNSLKGVSVEFNINGVFYYKISNSEGIASLNIDLNPGEYIITAKYNGFAVSNRIEVLKTIESENLVMYTNARTPFKVHIIDGKGNSLANAKVTFNINGVFYTKTTDSDGYALLNIELRAAKYIITTSFNDLHVSNINEVRES